MLADEVGVYVNMKLYMDGMTTSRGMASDMGIGMT